ncbi:hypothetical protein [Bifidobacterium phasiani]|uniref:PhnA protein n=1 Tax=Bifidobacterium phasiani TaxID=2834431 RepID=A0ABS6W669_9BIFI|nr:hypothetical protein [Bifidobacterium phasiani]MBW3081984.1 hypothetical protein [Bifidobacterium phasiani]
MSVDACQTCGANIENGYTLCPACELDFALLLLQYVPWVHALEASLDATVHPGGHQPTRIITPVAPTPLRLDVLDHIDLLATIAQGLWRRLHGVNILDWKRDLCPDIIGCLTDAAMHPNLARIPDIGMYVAQFNRLKTKTLEIIDPPDHMTPIGQCLQCGLTITAPEHAVVVTCPTCGREQTASAVRLDLLERSIRSGRTFTAGECARLLRGAGYSVSGSTIRSWKHRGLLQPQGKDDRNQPVYRLRDVAGLLRDTPTD